VGGDRPIELDIRVIAATNKDLKKSIKSGEFREDLYYRLKVIPIMVPPLRERLEDIPQLADHFVKRYSTVRDQRLSQRTYKVLQNYSWPGNVRELKNWVERACILNPSPVIDVADLDMSKVSDFWDVSAVDSGSDYEDKSLRYARAAFEKQFIERMLAENGGNVSKTAQRIGVERSHLHKKIKSYGIEVRDPGL
jgi:two-component system nitrogen regulation response regulator NtrX